MTKDLSASEAARVLGVSVATLYTYASRGLLTAVSNGTARSKRYPYDEVLRLATRNGDARRGGQMAAGAMHWGLPVLETQISQIAGGRLTYRGFDAIALAGEATLEQTASLLWDDSQSEYFAHAFPALPKELLEQSLAVLPDAAPLTRAMAVLPLLAGALPRLEDTGNAILQSGPSFMRMLAAILLRGEPSMLPLHLQLAQAWGGTAAEAELIRAALVLLADHDLNASTFAVRCVASTGAQLPAILCAGLAALSGQHHGGGSEAARSMLAGAMAAAEPAQFIKDFYQSKAAELAGFGHPLYPAGDPRAAYLLKRLSAMAQERQQLAAVLSICDLAAELLRNRPNGDMALAVLSLACGWPDSAGITLFAIARSAGWIAHAAEQAAAATLIRPRARYVGRYRHKPNPGP